MGSLCFFFFQKFSVHCKNILQTLGFRRKYNFSLLTLCYLQFICNHMWNSLAIWELKWFWSKSYTNFYLSYWRLWKHPYANITHKRMLTLFSEWDPMIWESGIHFLSTVILNKCKVMNESSSWFILREVISRNATAKAYSTMHQYQRGSCLKAF